MHWTLPEHIEDLLPADAAKLEWMRRVALDRFAACGYELVIPPLVEYVESLLSGVGHDMDLATFKLVDQLSGRMMGLRADTTPQVARIDAHVLNREGTVRLCYAGSVVHTRPAALGRSRQPFQAGAELYGYAGIEADIEIQQLMLDSLAALGVHIARLDIGQPAIFRRLADELPLDAERRVALSAAIDAKDIPALHALPLGDSDAAHALRALPSLYGGIDTLAAARARLPRSDALDAALDALREVAEAFVAQGAPVSIDLGALGGYNYESGIVFAAYAQGASDAVARGGRYDDVGRAFGRARPATGFSMDLTALLGLVAERPARTPILAPPQRDAALHQRIAALRAAGEIVIAELGDMPAGAYRRLVQRDGQWRLVDATDHNAPQTH